MFLIPLVILVGGGIWVYLLLEHRHVAATAGSGGPVAVDRAPFWPTTAVGKVSVVAFVLAFMPALLVNVVQVPFLAWILLLASLALSGVARFGQHDRSIAVLTIFIVTAIGATFSVLFLAGEVFIGHD